MLQVLLLFTEEQPTFSVDEIVGRTGIPPQSVYRYVSLLRELGLAEEHSYGRYALTPQALALGRAAEVVYAQSSVVHERLDHLAHVSGETSLLLRRVEDHAICAELVETPQTVRLSFRIGHRMPLHRGAAPKVLLAGLGEEWAQRYFRRCMPVVPEAERTERLRELSVIRERRWAESASEVDEGIWAVAAPIWNGDRMIAALTVAGPQFRITSRKAKTIRDEVVRVAADLSA
ncbi:IclR family transcriptional regulator [Agrococcus beijingensis]|uniref:IclR family transcriptional regulator n=1 Tax=Agrococcus beijingensis TaxID=3068634 RepID=UPI0027422C46|nr:IclR family transcriptional regulator [Agrococcus sp. REN33]